jgi:hypothetical protein
MCSDVVPGVSLLDTLPGDHAMLAWGMIVAVLETP